jgi:hypothetical protein
MQDDPILEIVVGGCVAVVFGDDYGSSLGQPVGTVHGLKIYVVLLGGFQLACPQLAKCHSQGCRKLAGGVPASRTDD